MLTPLPDSFENQEPTYESACFTHGPQLSPDWGYTQEELAAFAHGCLDVYSGSVALATFALSTEAAAELATDLEAYLPQLTRGVLTPAVEAIPASRNAFALLDRQTPDGCIDSEDFRTTSAYAADMTMPEKLARFDMVVGITDLPACDPQFNGVADQWISRYADVFSAEENAYALRDIAAHEILHLLGFGHYGDVSVGWTRLEDLIDENGGEPVVVDLVEHLNPDKTMYSAYGAFYDRIAGNVMGAADNDTRADLAPPRWLGNVQQYHVEWPARLLGSETSVTAVDILDGPVVFTTDSHSPELATVYLARHFEFPPDMQTDRAGGHFRTLVLEPVFGNYAGYRWVSEVDVYMTSIFGDIATLGYVHGKGDHRLVTIYGEITIAIAHDSVTVDYRQAAR